MSYYNERNGWEDHGNPLNPKNTKCPNCCGNNYIETVSREYCPDCGMKCDYWGNGSNEVYDQMMKRQWAEEERESEERFRKQMCEEWGDNYDEF